MRALRKLTAEHRAKLSASKTGVKNPMFGKAAWSRGLKGVGAGRVVSVETRKKLSESRLGKKPSEETRAIWRRIRTGRKVSSETKKKMSESHRGSKCHLWKGGVTKLHAQIRKSFEYRQWRSDVFCRDSFTCEECGVVGGNLHAHHLKSFSSILSEYKIETQDQARVSSVLWDINNGITLCVDCHKEAHKKFKRLSAPETLTLGDK